MFRRKEDITRRNLECEFYACDLQIPDELFIA